jgi:hypothetical protein
MTVKPYYMTGSGGSASTPGEDTSTQLLKEMPVNQVFVKNSVGKLVGIGIRQLSDGTVLAPDHFGVESGSVNFGDLITVSEASGYLGLYNHLDQKQYQLVDYYVPRDRASSKPFYFKLLEGEFRYDGSPEDTKTITTNPLTFKYVTQLDARTNSIILTAASTMKNVRIRISKGNITLKYLPTKAAYLGQETGYDFQVGENIIDFKDSPVPLSAGTELTYEILADSVSLKGSSNNVPKMSAYVQRGEYVGLLGANDISKVAFTGNYEDLVNKPVANEVDYPVDSVNDQTGDVKLTASDVGAAEVIHSHSISEIDGLQSSLDGKMTEGSSFSYNQIEDAPVLSEVATSGLYEDLSNKPELFSGSYNDLSNKPTLFSGKYSDLTGLPTLSTVSQTGSYTDLKDKPVLFDGSYNSLSNKPTIPASQVQSDWSQTNTSAVDFIKNKPTIPVVNYPVVSVNSKTGAVTLTASDVGAAAVDHTHSISEVSGLQTALDSKIGTGSTIPYSSLTGTPVIPAAQIQSNWTQTNTTALDYIKNKPTLFSGSYADLTGKPVVPTSLSQLTNDAGFLTAAPVTSVNTKTGAVVLSSTDIGAAPSAQGTRYLRQAGTQVSGVKVKYYTVTADSAGSWTLSLGTDFTEILDVQATALSTGSNLGGIRQATVNTYTATSTSLSGAVFTNTVIVTILLSGTNSLTMSPGATVKIRVEGV